MGNVALYDAAQGHWRQMQIPPVEYRMKHRAHTHQQLIMPSAMWRLSCLGPGGFGS